MAHFTTTDGVRVTRPARTLFDLAAHPLSPWFRSKEAHTHLHAAAQVNPFTRSDLSNNQSIGWSSGNDGYSEILHQLHLPSRQATTHRDNSCTNEFRANMCSKSTGK